MNLSSFLTSSFCARVRLFLYVIIGVYLLLISGSMFEALSNAIDDPSSILFLAGSALPSISNFFINMIAAQLLLFTPLQLLRPIPLLFISTFMNIFDQSKLSIREVVQGPLTESRINYGARVPFLCKTAAIALMLSTIAPILFAVYGVFFTVSYVVDKYHSLYVNVPRFETGGIFFYHLYEYTNIGLLASTITIFIFMAIKNGVGQACLLFPLPFVVVFVWRKTEEKYKNVTENYSLSLSSSKESDAGRAAEVVVSGFSEDFYLQPCLSDKGKDAVPYRIDNIPLFDKHGHLNAIYANCLKEPKAGIRSYEAIMTSGEKSIEDAENEAAVSSVVYGTFDG